MAIALGDRQEPFTGTVIPTGWAEFKAEANITYTAQGVNIIFPATTSSSTDGDINFAATSDATGSFGRLAVTSVPGVAATHTDAWYRVRQNSTNYIAIFYEGGTLFFAKVVAGAQTNIANVTYNSTTHAWWQIREKGGTTYWETSPDGKVWTTQTSQANPVTMTSVDILIAGLCFGADTSPANFSFRYHNYPQPGTTTSTSSTSISSTSVSTSSTSISTSSTSVSSTSISISTSSTSTSVSSTSTSITTSSTSISSTSTSSTSSSTSVSSTSTSLSSTSTSSTSLSSTSRSVSMSSTSISFSSTSISSSSTSASTSSTSLSTSSTSVSTTTTAIPPGLTYTYEDDDLLKTSGANLVSSMTSRQVSMVSGDDGDYWIETGSQYVIAEYKKQWANSTDNITVTWRGRTTLSTLISPVYLQIYNVNSTSWEIMCIQNKVPADTDFQMIDSQTTSLSNYYDANNVVSIRVYQKVI